MLFLQSQQTKFNEMVKKWDYSQVDSILTVDGADVDYLFEVLLLYECNNYRTYLLASSQWNRWGVPEIRIIPLIPHYPTKWGPGIILVVQVGLRVPTASY